MILSFSWFAGAAALVAWYTVGRLGPKELMLTNTLGVNALWLLLTLFDPAAYLTPDWHVASECLLALGMTFYVTQCSRFNWWLVTVLWAFIPAGIWGLYWPLSDHYAYRGLIPLDAAMVCVLFTQRGPYTKTCAHASIFLGCVFALNLFHHAAWELSVPLARALGRMTSVLYTLSMIAIAIVADRERRLNSNAR